MIVCHPAAFILFLPLAASYLLYMAKLRRVLAFAKITKGNPKGKRLVLGAILRAASMAFLIMALATVKSNEGKAAAPLRQDAGDGVSFVFDISYSMNALDAEDPALLSGQEKISRLEAAAKTARMMLPSMQGRAISCVLAKGDGVVAVPLTQDYEAVETLLDTLSSGLMSAAGTNLAKGIEAAQSTFPLDVAYRKNIWLFTDGDETSGNLKAAIERAAKLGSSVVLIGFGSTIGCRVTAGDGKTLVHTALKENFLIDCASAPVSGINARLYNRKTNAQNGNNTTTAQIPHQEGSANVRYIVASNAASILLSALASENNGGGKVSLRREGGLAVRGSCGAALMAALLFAMSVAMVQSVPLWDIFRAFAQPQMEVQPLHQSRYSAPTSVSPRSPNNDVRLAHILPMSIIFIVCVMCLAGCSVQSASQETLRGAWALRQGKTQKAAASFLRALQYSREGGDEEGAQYALYNIAAAYISMSEADAAIERMDQIADDAPATVEEAAAYNRGCIAYGHGKYEEAVSCFRMALAAGRSGSVSLMAKENLEIASAALREKTAKEKASAPMLAGKEEKALDALLERVREQDKKQWKAREQSITSPYAADY